MAHLLYSYNTELSKEARRKAMTELLWFSRFRAYISDGPTHRLLLS
jgi:hypothetical protein